MNLTPDPVSSPETGIHVITKNIFYSSNILLQYLQPTLEAAHDEHIFLLQFKTHCIPLFSKIHLTY